MPTILPQTINSNQLSNVVMKITYALTGILSKELFCLMKCAKTKRKKVFFHRGKVKTTRVSLIIIDLNHRNHTFDLSYNDFFNLGFILSL
jgi:hypothetical protein